MPLWIVHCVTRPSLPLIIMHHIMQAFSQLEAGPKQIGSI